MPNISFQNVVLRSLSRDRKGGRAAFTASLTAHVCRAMEWNEEIPDCLTKARPEGELIASEVRLTPGQKDLEKHAVELGISQIDGFEIVRRELESSRGKGHRLELRFNVHFTDSAGCAALEQYLQTIGEGKSKLSMLYQKQAKQESLISEEQAADTASEG